MKLQRIAAGILAAVMLTAAGTAGTRGNGFCVVSEAASKLAAPEITSTSSTTSTVTLKWGKVSGADGYIIYKADRITKKFEEYKKVASEKCKVTGLLSGAAYRFQVAAFTDTKGKISVQKKTDIIKVTTQKLPAPGSLKASASDSTVKLTWNKVTGADKYRVYMYDSASGKYKEYAETEDTSYTAEGLVNGKSYKFMTAAEILRRCHFKAFQERRSAANQGFHGLRRGRKEIQTLRLHRKADSALLLDKRRLHHRI